MSFIPLIHKNTPLTCEAALKYFIIQALASIIVIFSFTLNFIFYEQFYLQSTIHFFLNSAFLIKIGIAPFHFWFVEVIEGLNWFNTLILLTWQKIAPSVILIYNLKLSLFIFIVIVTGILVRGIQRWNQIRIKKILVYSSINHISWILILILYSQNLWRIYFLIYRFLNFRIILIFNFYKINSIQKLNLFLNSNKNTKIAFFLRFFSLGGIPPFLGFFPKWVTLNLMIESNLISLRFLIVILTLLIIYTYIRLTFQSIVISIAEKKIISFKLNFLTWLIISVNLRGLILTTLIFNYF